MLHIHLSYVAATVGILQVTKFHPYLTRGTSEYPCWGPLTVCSLTRTDSVNKVCLFAAVCHGGCVFMQAELFKQMFVTVNLNVYVR